MSARRDAAVAAMAGTWASLRVVGRRVWWAPWRERGPWTLVQKMLVPGEVNRDGIEDQVWADMFLGEWDDRADADEDLWRRVCIAGETVGPQTETELYVTRRDILEGIMAEWGGENTVEVAIELLDAEYRQRQAEEREVAEALEDPRVPWYESSAEEWQT